ncbi:MAG TPA: adenylate/guanylate cyclase domain-containing protein [Ilumatobacteraceae bacterium]|nr:adenylate/guanylate cyclase domain-containing protein [Ilumatobacteraceae bacterium]
MPRLDAKERAALPDRAFAYIDSQGRRRLPIHDAAHVRNALVRFGQVGFEDERAREQARLRLLNAAKKFKIVPVGFIAGQLVQERAQRAETVQLPSGFVTMLMTDIEGSTAIVQRLGARYRDLIDDVWGVLRGAVAEAGGHEVEARADEFFAVFESPRDAVDAAIALQQAILGRAWVDNLDVRVRVGIHSGYPTSTADNYVGMDVHTASRICSVGHGGQIVVSANTREGVKASAPHGVRFKALGAHKLRGLPELVELYQLGARGLPTRFPPLRT